MQFIILAAAFLLSCLVLVWFLGELVAAVWRPALAILIGAVVFWTVLRLMAGVSFETHLAIAQFVSPILAVGACFVPLLWGWIIWDAWRNRV